MTHELLLDHDEVGHADVGHEAEPIQKHMYCHATTMLATNFRYNTILGTVVCPALGATWT
jgi:hypothetical protein